MELGKTRTNPVRKSVTAKLRDRNPIWKSNREHLWSESKATRFSISTITPIETMKPSVRSKVLPDLAFEEFFMNSSSIERFSNTIDMKVETRVNVQIMAWKKYLTCLQSMIVWLCMHWLMSLHVVCRSFASMLLNASSWSIAKNHAGKHKLVNVWLHFKLFIYFFVWIKRVRVFFKFKLLNV